MYIKHSSLIYMGMFYSLLLPSPSALLLLRWPSITFAHIFQSLRFRNLRFHLYNQRL